LKELSVIDVGGMSHDSAQVLQEVVDISSDSVCTFEKLLLHRGLADLEVQVEPGG
jgi:hypothetical protein